MAKVVDITSKITNDLPIVKITDDIIVTINNRKSNVLNVMAMANEKAKKKEATDIDIMEASLKLLIGEENAKKIEELDLPISEYREVYTVCVSLAQGRELDNKDTP